jgi:hypothetical protein
MGEHAAGPDPATPGEPGPNDTTWVLSDPDAVPTWRPASSGPRRAPSPSGSVSPPGDVFQRPRAEASYYPPTEFSAPPLAERSGPAAPPWGDMSGYPEPPVERPRTELSGYPAAPAERRRTEFSEYPAERPRTEFSGSPAAPAERPRTELSGYPEAAAGQPPAGSGRPPAPGGYVRYGPGVPAAVAPPASAAERIWRTGPVPDAPRRRPRWRRALGSAVTVLLLAVAALVLFLRLHHPAFDVTGAAITQQTRNGCGVDVTGRITTSGGAGTVSYQWVFRPDTRPPVPLTQTVIAGQKAVFVTVAVEGSGRGSAAQSVTLQVLGPQKRAASASVVVRC